MPLPFRKIALALTPAVALASVADTPNSLAASQSLACRPFVDFSNPKEVRRWRVVNDGVMGGLSSGEMRVDDGTMLYTGLINTNGGGFSSIRRTISPGTLRNAVALKFNHADDGRVYKVSIRSSAAYRRRPISFQAPIPPRDQGAVVALDDLRGSFRGYQAPGAQFDRDQAFEIGIILSDGIDGPFEMSMRSIEICEAAI